MDSESIVYGCITDGYAHHQSERFRTHNRAVIMNLPVDDPWVYLTRDMFAMPSLANISVLKSGVIHFGASYQAIEYEWSRWIDGFENLLAQLYWSNAVVQLETELHGHHTFTWSARGDLHLPGMDVKQVRREWSRESALV